MSTNDRYEEVQASQVELSDVIRIDNAYDPQTWGLWATVVRIQPGMSGQVDARSGVALLTLVCEQRRGMETRKYLHEVAADTLVTRELQRRSDKSA